MSAPAHTVAGGVLSLERLVFFSDAVFVIAITLLVVELEVPHLANLRDDAAAWQGLVHLWSSFFVFAVSFLVIGRFWMGHHDLFRHITTYHSKLMWPNLMLLMAIAFLPFSTAYLRANLGAFVPALFYNVSLLVIALFDWRLASRAAVLGVLPPRYRRGEAWHSTVVVAAASLCVALTWLSRSWSQIGLILIPIGHRLIDRRLAL